jgi:cytochrome P450
VSIGSDSAHAGLFALDPHTVRCPHEVLARLREESPARWIDEIEAYAVTRYEDIVFVNRHPELFSSRTATGPVLARQMAETIGALVEEDPEVREVITGRAARGRTAVLLNADPPLHSRQRKLVNRSFSLRAAKAREDDIRRLADELIDAFPADGEVELVSALGVPLPLAVIADALGVPLSDMADFKRWSDDFVVAIGNHNLSKDDLRRMLQSQAAFFSYFADQIADRRVTPRDDVVTEVVTSRLDGEELTEAEMLSMFSQFLVAGNETTTKLIASAALRLALDPALADRLRGEPALVGELVEEVLRLEAPVQGLFRVATAATEVGGVPIPEGAHLWVVYAAGNRDGSVFPSPDECVLDRQSRYPHLAFGVGEHFCLGASLARIEAKVALERLLGRYGTIELVGAVDDLEYEASYVLHGLRRLPLRLTASEAGR